MFKIQNGVLKQYIGNDTVVEIPNGVTSIGKDAFKENVYITKVILPNDITSIGDMAFFGCKNLKIVNFPYGLRSIDSYAFKYTSVREVNLPDSVINMGDFVFDDGIIVKVPKRLSSLKYFNFPLDYNSVIYKLIYQEELLEERKRLDVIRCIGRHSYFFDFDYLSSLMLQSLKSTQINPTDINVYYIADFYHRFLYYGISKENVKLLFQILRVRKDSKSFDRLSTRIMFDKILKDDTSFMEDIQYYDFSPSEIDRFLDTSIKGNHAYCTMELLNYKRIRYGDTSKIDEFSID